MNDKRLTVAPLQVEEFQDLVSKLYRCCQERMQFQSEKFGLPDAELRTLLLFGEERYLTAKGIARRLNVAKSRVTRIVQGLAEKGLVNRTPDPHDSRVTLLSLTPAGRNRVAEVDAFQRDVHAQALSRLPEADRRELLEALKILKQTMEETKELMI